MENLFLLNAEIKDHKGDVVIYGTSPKALLLFAMLLNHDVYVKCFCDADTAYHAVTIMNKPCIPLEELKNLNDPIVLLGDSNTDVIDRLLEEGVREDAIYVDDYKGSLER